MTSPTVAFHGSSELERDINRMHHRLCSLIFLAFYSISQGDLEKDARKSAFFYDEAAAFLNECDKINPEHPLLWVSKGALIMSRNRMLRERHVYESARAHFLFALGRYPEFTPALIGQVLMVISSIGHCRLFHGGI